ncbi:unnamed protein product [Moneuplotes crassus]|uniref:DNA replication complex GINS protein PSF3 n=1 Tax=Euplotes crassus TaxID=5936 RepID=A0AAD1XWH5_EUPCR|nr:unnamed protein product [Moneuplotes crassus]
MDTEDYWSIDTILAEEQKIKCSMLTSIHEYGHLCEAGKENLEEGDKLEMPLWLAKSLYSEEKVDIAIPKFFSTSFRETLAADSTIVLLKDKCNYFYENATILSEILKSEKLKEIIPVVHKAFVERMRMISDYAEGESEVQNNNMFIRRLCHIEKELFVHNKQRIKETVNFKQQHSVQENYGAQDNSMRKPGKRVRHN